MPVNLGELFRNKHGRPTTGVLFFGDNLDVMQKYLPDESVDLIYLDPPFNSKASYNILFKEPTGAPSAAQIRAFEDTWHWGEESEAALRKVVETGPDKTSKLLNSLVESALGRNDVTAYLVMMAIRILEFHRLLKKTGSLYLHCDPTMSHYIKAVLDSVFGPRCFQNEIIWKRTFSHKAKRWGRIHDVILFYTKDPTHYKWNPPIQEYDRDYINKFFRFEDERGRYRLVILTGPGTAKGESGQPWRGYDPTQKPEKLLERIDEGDIVLDPFCGCGTTVSVAQRMGRLWIGIDITHLAVNLIKSRLKDQLNLIPGEDYVVYGEPVDLAGADALAKKSRYEFEYWALSLLPPAKPVKSRETGRSGTGADTGYDGIIYLADGDPRKPKYKRTGWS